MPHGGPIHVQDLMPGGAAAPPIDAIRSATELIFYSLLNIGDDGLLTSLDFSVFIGVESGADQLEDGDIGIMYERIDDEDETAIFKIYHSIETVSPPTFDVLYVDEAEQASGAEPEEGSPEGGEIARGIPGTDFGARQTDFGRGQTETWERIMQLSRMGATDQVSDPTHGLFDDD